MTQPATVRTRTPEEKAANDAKLAAEARTIDRQPPPAPRLVEVTGDPVQMRRIELAAETLYPGEGALAVVRVAMQQAGLAAPDATALPGFLQGLGRLGFRPVPTCFANPLPGSLYVRCGPDRDPIEIGIVTKVQADKGREKFYRAATTEREVRVSAVEFWMMSPTGCQPCAERKQTPVGAAG